MMAQKEKFKKEEKEKVRKALICEKCGSKYTYALANESIRCRNCGHLKKKEN